MHASRPWVGTMRVPVGGIDCAGAPGSGFYAAGKLLLAGGGSEVEVAVGQPDGFGGGTGCESQSRGQGRGQSGGGQGGVDRLEHGGILLVVGGGRVIRHAQLSYAASTGSAGYGRLARGLCRQATTAPDQRHLRTGEWPRRRGIPPRIGSGDGKSACHRCPAPAFHAA